jgi:hypothetical protein
MYSFTALDAKGAVESSRPWTINTVSGRAFGGLRAIIELGS